MENVYENVRRELTPENVKEVLQVMLERVHLPENEAKIMSAKEQAGDDMVEVMKTVFPMVLEIQIEVIGKFGYVSTQEGLKDFLIRVNQLTTENKEILDLLLKIRETYLPGFSQKGNSQPHQQEPGSGGGSNNSTGLTNLNNNPTKSNGPSTTEELPPVAVSIGVGGGGSGGNNSNVGSVGSGGSGGGGSGKESKKSGTSGAGTSPVVAATNEVGEPEQEE